VILHDVGKIHELNYERGFSYSNEGQLLGHINIGLRMVGEKLRGLPDFPPALRSLVEHMILSHHGQLEFGSPKLPQFPEALLLHYLDDMDSKMECMRALIENDRQVEGCFTTYHPALERPALKKERFLNGEAEPPRARPVVQGEPSASSPPDRTSGTAGNSGATETPEISGTAGSSGTLDTAPTLGNAGAAETPEISGTVGTPGDGRAPGMSGSTGTPGTTDGTPVAAAPSEGGAPAAKGAHPLFAAKPDSHFADKLKQALQSSIPKQES